MNHRIPAPEATQHAEVRRAADLFESILFGLGSGDEPPDAEGLAAARLAAFGRVLRETFSLEEREGCLAFAAAAAPHLARRTEALRAEHRRLRAELDALAAAVQRACGTPAGWRAVRNRLAEMRRELRAHEAREDEVVRRALFEDHGGGG